MRNDNWGGGQADRSTDNWTGRVARQSRITGEWASSVKQSKHISGRAYAGAVIVLLAFWLVNFL
jgi:hypothetical protein